MPCLCDSCIPLDRKVKAEREKRAEELFLTFLTERQKTTIEKSGFFEVTGSDGCIYRIYTHSYAGNISYYSPFGLRYVCCYPQRPMYGYLPKFDRILGQMLAIQTDAKHFVSVAYGA